LAVAAVGVIARHVPHDGSAEQAVPMRSELAAVRSGPLWLVLAACATTTGGVLSVYSYISPLLTDRAGIAVGLVPMVLVGFGVGSLVGTVYGGRLGDVHPHTTTIAVPAATTVVLLGIFLVSAHPMPTVVLIILLGLVGLSANPVLSSLAVRFAGVAPTLGVAMSVSAYNFGTAVGSWIAGSTLSTGLGASGPAVVGTVVVALTLIPTIAITRGQRRRRATHAATVTDSPGVIPVEQRPDASAEPSMATRGATR